MKMCIYMYVHTLYTVTNEYRLAKRVTTKGYKAGFHLARGGGGGGGNGY